MVCYLVEIYFDNFDFLCDILCQPQIEEKGNLSSTNLTLLEEKAGYCQIKLVEEYQNDITVECLTVSNSFVKGIVTNLTHFILDISYFQLILYESSF